MRLTGDHGAQRRSLTFAQRVALLVGLLVVGILALLLVPPIPQDPRYHEFADTRSWLGIPNAGNVLSNAAFALVGIAGLRAVTGARRRVIFADALDARPYLVFFAALVLVALGSAYYHLAPSTERLFWDRLPMTLAFAALCAAIVADRIAARAGATWLLALLVGVGALSLVWWAWSEALGRGDLRPYGFVQFFPVIALPVLCLLFPGHRYLSGRDIAWLVAWYGLSKLLEHLDGQVLQGLGFTLSGHTLKHLVAAGATCVVLRALLRRRAAAASRAAP